MIQARVHQRRRRPVHEVDHPIRIPASRSSFITKCAEYGASADGS
ncbi:MAG: hypothetical protein R3F14_03300 [Polyangiaceae bacterium]